MHLATSRLPSMDHATMGMELYETSAI
eukprot:SAG31_NODE_38401_length_296_cov_1.045685_1_plen_26_part_10